jgi:multiple sugar transport system substrate-binding protein
MRRYARRGPSTPLRGATALLAIALIATACGTDGATDTADADDAPTEEADAAGDDAAGDDAEPAAELSDEPVELTFWSWSPDIEQQVALFEAEYPNISVEVVNAGQGTAQYERLRTSFTAGSGAPDVAHFATAFLPEFILRDELVDLVPYGANDLRDDYTESAWALVSQDDAVYGYPWDTGPLAMLYREDIFDEYGIEVPETWEEFGQAARDLKEADPDIYLSEFPGVIPQLWQGLVWQAGANPFQIDGTSLDIDLVDDASIRVAEFWGPLVADGVLATDPPFTTEWFNSFASGRYATWITAAWGPGLLAGAAEESFGNWRVAPIPQWEAGDNASAHWGGSTLSVLKQSEHPAEAELLVRYLLNDPEPARLFTEVQFLFPTLLELREDPDWRDEPFEFYGGQAVNQVFAESEEGVDTSWQWSPITAFVDEVLEEELLAETASGDFAGALERTQQRVQQYAEEQGFD